MKKECNPELSTVYAPADVNGSPQGQASNSDEISLVDLVLILWKGKYIIAACTFLATLAGIIYALTATDIFSTSTQFITKTGNNSSGNLSQLA